MEMTTLLWPIAIAGNSILWRTFSTYTSSQGWPFHFIVRHKNDRVLTDNEYDLELDKAINRIERSESQMRMNSEDVLN